MATAGEVAEKALKRILVQAADAPLEPDEYQDFLATMNDYMEALYDDGIRLGYTNVDNLADEVTVPAGAIRGIIANVAIEVSPDYGGSVSSELVMQAREGMKTMRKLGQTTIKTSYPSTLPQGSGNDDYAQRTTQFYTMQSLARLSLAGNTRATAFAVTDTAYPVAGFWRVEATKSFRGDIDGAVQNVTAVDVDADVKITLSATGNSTYTFRLMLNGISQHAVSAALTSTPADVTVSKLVTVAPGDILQLWVEDDLATASATVASAQFEVN